MASPTSLGAALWQDGPTYNGEIIRQMDVASGWTVGGTADAISVTSGVINSPVQSLKVLAVSGMGIKVSAGFAIVANSSSNTMAGYKIGSMTSTALTVDTADGTNPRIDIVVIGVNENGDSTSAGYLQIITGTPASSPVAPSVPENALKLAQIAVAANATSVSQSNITDSRTFSVAAGGVQVYTNMSGVPTGFTGLIAYDAVNNRFFHDSASGVTQLAVLPWKPVQVAKSSTQTLTTSSATVLSTSVTVNGSTDLRITFNVPGVYQTTNAGPRVYYTELYVDGTQIMNWANVTTSSVAGTTHNGGTFEYTTSSATSDTPASGSHTIYIKSSYLSSPGSGDAPVLWATSTSQMTLRVEPVVQ